MQRHAQHKRHYNSSTTTHDVYYNGNVSHENPARFPYVFILCVCVCVCVPADVSFSECEFHAFHTIVAFRYGCRNFEVHRMSTESESDLNAFFSSQQQQQQIKMKTKFIPLLSTSESAN